MKLIGRLSSSAIAALSAPLQYRALQRQQIQELFQSQNYDSSIVLTEEVRGELDWWCQNLHLSNGQSLIATIPQLVISSDASTQGWGAYCKGLETGGQWSAQEMELHINMYELKAAKLAIVSFHGKFPTAMTIHIQMDNIVALTYLKKNGWYTMSHLDGNEQRDMEVSLGSSDHDYCRIPSGNSERESRLAISQCERLKRVDAKYSSVSSIVQGERDTVHGSFCFQVESPSSSVLLLKNRSLQARWTHVRGYAFPPFCLIGKVLWKVQTDLASIKVGPWSNGYQCGMRISRPGFNSQGVPDHGC